MLKVLFSPSEGKNSGGNEAKKELLGSNEARESIFNEYNKIVMSEDEEQIKNLFGIKKFTDCQPYIQDIFSSPLMCAIERYQGVAYDYLEYKTLSPEAQNYLKKHTIIFSNLYGAILGGDTIANYKVKQGNNIGEISPDKFYKKRFSYQLDLFLAKDEILDLRAGYYDKFYKANKNYTTLKFLKGGKSVSHWAKAYRGKVLKALSKLQPKTKEELMAIEFKGLKFIESVPYKRKGTMLVYEVI